MRDYDKWAKVFENLFGLCFFVWIAVIVVNEAIYPLKYWLGISIVAVGLGLVFNWLSDRFKDKAKKKRLGKRK